MCTELVRSLGGSQKPADHVSLIPLFSKNTHIHLTLAASLVCSVLGKEESLSYVCPTVSCLLD